MLVQLFALYLESLVLTILLVLVVLGLWIGFRALTGVDKTAKERQAHLYDMIMIGVSNNSSIVFCNHEHLVGSQGIIVVK